MVNGNSKMIKTDTNMHMWVNCEVLHSFLPTSYESYVLSQVKSQSQSQDKHKWHYCIGFFWSAAVRGALLLSKLYERFVIFRKHNFY